MYLLLFTLELDWLSEVFVAEDELAWDIAFLDFITSNSAQVSTSTKTLSFSLEKAENSIFTNTENFLMLPALCVISSISVSANEVQKVGGKAVLFAHCDVNSALHLSLLSYCSISMVNTDEETWTNTKYRILRWRLSAFSKQPTSHLPMKTCVPFNFFSLFCQGIIHQFNQI